MTPSPPSTGGPEVATDITRRIMAAADQLYVDCAKSTFPNVDQVRKLARVNMNDASTVMRAWRRAQGASSPGPAAQLPARIQDAGLTLIAQLWQAASEEAATHLQTAQAGWQLERTEAEANREQIATAFDQQTQELAEAQASIEELKRMLSDRAEALRQASAEQQHHQVLAAELKTQTEQTRLRYMEVIEQAAELKSELAQTRAALEQAREQQNQHAERALSERAQFEAAALAREQTVASLREQLAHMQGKLDVLRAPPQTLPEATKKRAGDNRSRTGDHG